MVGLLTLVTSRVGSTTSTSFRVNFRDMWTFSGPMLPASSGTFPGHISTTIGLSAPAAGQAAHNQMITETAAAIRFMVDPLISAPGEPGLFLLYATRARLTQKAKNPPMPRACPRPIDGDDRGGRRKHAVL